MAKKKRDERVSSEPSALKHNPFAALAAKFDAPSAHGAPAAQPERPTQDAARGAAPALPTGTARAARENAPAKSVQPAQSAAAAGQVRKQERAKSAGRLVLRRETKGRGGKAVIVITGFSALPSFGEAATQELAQKLKQQLGCGGTVEDKRGEREIILQGDRAAKVAELLRALDFRVDGVTS